MNTGEQMTCEKIARELHPADVRVFGVAPKMKVRQLTSGTPRKFALVFGEGDDVVAGIRDLAQNEQLKSASFTAIGALRKVSLGFFDRNSKRYHTYIVPQCELLNLTGNVTKKGDIYVVHAHATVSLPRGETKGGHLFLTEVWPTVELFLHEYEVDIERKLDPDTNLSLICP